MLLHRTPYNRRDFFRVSGIVADPLRLATADMHHTARPGGVFELGFLTTYGLVLCLEGLDHCPLNAAEQEQVRKQLIEAFAGRSPPCADCRSPVSARSTTTG